MTFVQESTQSRNTIPRSPSSKPPSSGSLSPSRHSLAQPFDAHAPWLPVLRLLDVGHSKLAYRCVGTGPDLMFVHGWPLHAATFRKLLPRLSQHFTCHLLDLPGCGDSEWGPRSRMKMDDHIESIRQAIEQLGLSRYALLAFDSGGLMARFVAEGNPAVCGLVLGNTEITEHVAWQVRLYGVATKLLGAGGFATLLKSRMFRRSSLAFGGSFSDLTMLEGDFHELFVAPLLEQPRVLTGQMQQLIGFDLSATERLAAVHRRISAPVLFIWGEDDPFFPLKRARRMLDEFAAGAQMVTLKPAKLLVHEERPEAFVKAAVPFLQRAFGAA